jgi:hypothetical protein
MTRPRHVLHARLLLLLLLLLTTSTTTNYLYYVITNYRPYGVVGFGGPKVVVVAVEE